jgi:hypothetical protein
MDTDKKKGLAVAKFVSAELGSTACARQPIPDQDKLKHVPRGAKRVIEGDSGRCRRLSALR